MRKQLKTASYKPSSATISIGVILFITILAATTLAYTCQDKTDLKYIPCEMITPANMNCTTNATITYLNNQSINISTNMTIKTVANDTYNFTFPANYTHIGNYRIRLCDNSTADMYVGNLDEDYNDKWLYFYGFSLLLGAGLLIISYKKEDKILGILAGFLFAAFALTFTKIGYPTLNNSTLNLSIILVTSGIGGVVMLSSVFKLMQDGL